MKSSMTRLSRAFAVAFTSALAAAPGLSVANTQLSGVTIVAYGIYAGNSGALGAYVTFSPAAPGLENCPNTVGNELWIDFSSTTQPDGKSLYATLVSAALAGQTVTFGLAGCGDSGQVPLVYRIDVHLTG